jgi:hypothetical protein
MGASRKSEREREIEAVYEYGDVGDGHVQKLLAPSRGRV